MAVIESREPEHINTSYIGWTEYNGEPLRFVVWPEYETPNHRRIEQVLASAFIARDINPEALTSVGMQTIKTIGLNIERPVAVAVNQPNKGWQVSAPEEFPEEERMLRESFAKYLREDYSIRDYLE